MTGGSGYSKMIFLLEGDRLPQSPAFQYYNVFGFIQTPISLFTDIQSSEVSTEELPSEGNLPHQHLRRSIIWKDRE